MTIQTLEQQYASLIYEQVKDYGDKHQPKDNPDRKKYGSMAHKLPILVHTSGLAQSIAYVMSRGKDAHNKLIEDMAQVVANCGKKEFWEKCIQAELQEYIYLTRKTMLALNWYKRFAQSVLEIDPTDDGEEDSK